MAGMYKSKYNKKKQGKKAIYADNPNTITERSMKAKGSKPSKKKAGGEGNKVVTKIAC